MFVGTILVAALALSGAAHAQAKIAIDDNKEATLGFLLQPQIRSDFKGNSEGGPGVDFFLRRARIMVSAKYTDKLYFFFDTDTPNLGKDGNWGTVTDPTTGKVTTDFSQYVQDAWVEYNVAPYLQIDSGLILVPFSYHGYQGATSLMMSDYHASLIKYVSGTNRVWRDAGIMVRGEVGKKGMLEYRLAVTNGVETKLGAVDADIDGDGVVDPDPRGYVNPKDMPRVVGRVAFNVFSSLGGPGVGGFYTKGAHIKKDGRDVVTTKKVLTFGASVDYQGDAVYTATDNDGDWTAPAMAVAIDAMADIPLNKAKTQAFTGQFDYYIYGQGAGAVNTGMGGFGEVGFRVNWWQPVVSYEWFNVADEALKQDYRAVLGGVNWWWKAHNANVKVAVGSSQCDTCKGYTEQDWSTYAVVQNQFLF